MRRTYSVVQVALALMSEPTVRHWGYDLSKRSGIRSAAMYPILRKMLEKGWLDDGWEDQVQAGQAKRPPRRYYVLTDTGRTALGALVAEARHDARFSRLVAGQIFGGAVG